MFLAGRSKGGWPLAAANCWLVVAGATVLSSACWAGAQSLPTMWAQLNQASSSKHRAHRARGCNHVTWRWPGDRMQAQASLQRMGTGSADYAAVSNSLQQEDRRITQLEVRGQGRGLGVALFLEGRARDVCGSFPRLLVGKGLE